MVRHKKELVSSHKKASVAEILKVNKTVGEGCGRGYLHTEFDKKVVTSRCRETTQVSRK